MRLEQHFIVLLLLSSLRLLLMLCTRAAFLVVTSQYWKDHMAAYQCRAVMHVYEVRPRKDKRGVDLISDVLPFGRLWYGEPNAVSKRNRIRAILQPLT